MGPSVSGHRAIDATERATAALSQITGEARVARVCAVMPGEDGARAVRSISPIGSEVVS